MSFYALPQVLYGLDGINEVLYHDNNAILHKKLNQELIDSEKLIVSHSIVYVISGTVKVNTYAGDEVVISKGEMLFMPRDTYLISDYMNEGKPMEVFLLFFNQAIVEKYLQNFQPTIGSHSAICSLHVNKNIEYYFTNIMQMEYANSDNRLLLEAKLLEFLHLLEDEHFKDTLFASEYAKQQRDIDSLMLQHFDKNLSVTDFASLSGRSLSTFNRLFKAKHEKTPKQWLIEKKINKAHALLESGLNVTDTAFEVGYKNVSQFIKAYKSIYTLTPKEMQLN